MHKFRYIFAVLVGASLMMGTTVYALPYFQQTMGLIPGADDRDYIGTTTPSNLRYKGVNAITGTFTNIITSSCSGCAGFGATWELITNVYSQSALAPTTTQNIHVSGVGTSTFSGGLEAWREIASPYFNATSTTGYQQYGTKVLTTGATNRGTFVGQGAGTSTNATSGLDNTFLGYWAGQANTTADANTALGAYALMSNLTGGSNTAVGYFALNLNTAGQNTGIGRQALQNNSTGANNVALGHNVLSVNTTGAQNIAIGAFANTQNTLGNDNVAIGYRALYEKTSGSHSVAIGTEAGGNATSNFSSSTLTGYRAGYSLTTGSRNVLYGFQAGDAISSGQGNLIFGYDIDAPVATGNNQLSIGNLIFGTDLDATSTTISSGKIGIGTTTPYAKLSVVGEIVGSHFTATTTSTSTLPRLSTNLASTTILYLDQFIEGTEITTPDTPATNKGRIYFKDNELGETIPYALSDLGVEYDLTGGSGGGCSTLDCLSDVTTGSLASSSILTYSGTEWVDNTIDFNWLRGFATGTQGGTGYATSTLGDLMYGGATNNWIKLGIGSSGKFLTVTGGVPAWGDAVDLTSPQTLTSGIKTFNVYPEGPATNATTSRQFITLQQFLEGLTGRSAHDAVQVATTSQISLSGVPIVDGYQTILGDRVLINSGTTTPPNGCYVTAAGAWSRCTDYDAAAEVTNGSYFPVATGTANKLTVQAMTSPSVVTLGTDPITFTKLLNTTAYTASLGVELVGGSDFRADLLSTGAITLSGNELLVNVDGSSIERSANAIRVKAAGITNAMLAGSIDLTTKVTGILPVANGGTNLSASADDNVMVGNGTTWQTKALTNCTDTGGQHLNYTTATNEFSCGTSGGSAGGSGGNATTSTDVTFLGSNATTRTWTNMPVATTELFGATDLRRIFGSTYATYYRIKVKQTVAGFAGADLNLQCSAVGVVYMAADTGGAGEVDVGTGTGDKIGTAVPLVAGCQGANFWRIVGKQGNATADPRFTDIVVEFYHPVGGGASSASGFITIAADGSLSAERVLTGTTNQITVTDGGANTTATLSIPIDFTIPNANTTGSILFAGAGLSAAVSQNNGKFFWDNSGFKLGIGTSTPGLTISSYGGIMGTYFSAASSTATSTFAGGLTIGSLATPASSLFTIGTTSPVFYIDRINGLTGIGTTTPRSNFHVTSHGTTTATTTIEIGDQYQLTKLGSRSCINMKSSSGAVVSAYITGTSWVIEANRCR